MADPTPRANPYKGPYAFELRDAALFIGRDEEAETLLSLAISERIVVFCAPSGAGKSSLLNARLVPGLRRRGFKVLPVVRVGGDLPPGVTPANVFAFNALWILAGSKADPTTLQSCTLDGFLKPAPRGQGRKGPPRVLIFDQFEEVLTTHPDRWPERKDFFLQLRQALLDDPTLSVVMSLREDHLAGLDAFAPLLPGQLRTRFRMETLRSVKAVAAARQPALDAGRPFEPEVAERLVEDLSRVRVAGRQELIAGEFVEPVQLQVVCYQLWENLRDQPGATISEADRRAYGNPDQALEGFYESAVRLASEKARVPEARIRRWCGTALITPSRIRSQVAREAEASGGLPNAAIESLVDSHLVRAEAARGGIWYELAHDRFIEPILRSNARTDSSETAPLTAAAHAWQSARRDPSFLYRGLRLAEALRSTEATDDSLGPLEKEFLLHSQKAETDAQVRKTRRLWFVVAALTFLVLAALGSAYVAWQQSRLATARELALAAIAQTDDDPDLSLLLALEAARKAPILETETALHEALRASLVRWERSVPVSSASSFAFDFSPDGKRFAAVSALGPVGIWDTASGQNLFLGPRPGAPITSVAYSHSDGFVAYGDESGKVTFWNPLSGSPPPPLAIGHPISTLAYSPDGSLLAIASQSPEVRLWNARQGTLKVLPGDPEISIFRVAFSRDGKYLAMVPEIEHDEGEGRLIIQNLENESQLVLTSPSPVVSVAFSPDGLLAAGCMDNGLRIWDIHSRRILQTLFGHRSLISDVAFSPDGNYLGSVSFDEEARLWNPVSGKSLFVLSPEGGQLSRIVFSPVPGKMAIVGEAVPTAPETTGTVTLWDIVLDDKKVFPTRARHLAGFMPDSRGLLVTTENQVVPWTFLGKESKLSLLVNASPITSARLTPLGLLVAFNGRDRELLRQSISPPWTLRKAPFTPNLRMGDFQISKNGLFLAGADGMTAYLLDLRSSTNASPGFEIKATLRQLTPVSSLALSPDGAWLTVADDQGALRIWEPGLKRVRFLRPGGDRVSRIYDLEISPDGLSVASAEEDRTVKLWDVKTGEPRQVFEGHGGRVIAVAFSPDSQRLASADEEGGVRLWEIAEGRSIVNFQGHTAPVTEMAFSPDGKWLATLDSNGTVQVDPLALEDLTRQARNRALRSLTPQERRIYLHSN